MSNPEYISLGFRSSIESRYSNDHSSEPENVKENGSFFGRFWRFISSSRPEDSGVQVIKTAIFQPKKEDERDVSSSMELKQKDFQSLKIESKENSGEANHLIRLTAPIIAIASKVFSFIHLPDISLEKAPEKENHVKEAAPRGMRYANTTESEEGIQVLKENFRYAAYMYDGSFLENKKGAEHGMQITLSNDKPGDKPGVNDHSLVINHFRFLKNERRYESLPNEKIKDDYAFLRRGPVKNQHEKKEKPDVDVQKLDLRYISTVGYNKKYLFFKENHIRLLNNVANGIKELGFNVDEDGHFYDVKTGTIFNLVFDKDNNELNVCFLGSGNEHVIKDVSESDRHAVLWNGIKAIGYNVVGGCPDAMTQAMKIGELLKAQTEKSDIKPILVGHSHGGALAQAAAIKNGLKAVVFNAEPLGVGVKRAIDASIGKEVRKANTNQVTAFSSKGDWLSDGAIAAICRFGRDRGWPVPTVLGKGYQLPGNESSDKEGWMLKHNNFYGHFGDMK